MAKKLTAVLLATNLRDYNKVAFDVAMSMCTHYDAKLVLLHVLEKIPMEVESLLTRLLDEKQREEINKSYAEDVKRKLVGKDISSEIIRSSLDDYCKKSGIEPTKSGFPSREIIVCEGDVAENILSYAKQYDCGMIVLAAHEGLFSKSSISTTIKSVLKQSTVPVLTVPHVFS